MTGVGKEGGIMGGWEGMADEKEEEEEEEEEEEKKGKGKRKGNVLVRNEYK
ncbi:hypothetical protein MMC19_005917 [Ptychographa xylographoides]|nr:hypothetical protein [Ptychographa xylographoides]